MMPRIVMGKEQSLLRLVNNKITTLVKTALFVHLVIVALSILRWQMAIGSLKQEGSTE